MITGDKNLSEMIELEKTELEKTVILYQELLEKLGVLNIVPSENMLMDRKQALIKAVAVVTSDVNISDTIQNGARGNQPGIDNLIK